MSHQSELIASDINAYLQQHENKELLRFITCGSVDDGKSTLIGRLLHDSKMIYEDQLAAIHNDSKRVGTTGEAPDLALLVDGLQAEREQGITIDVAYRYFSTAKRKFIIADTPGHEQYTRNMATGASTADLAIILIDARYGVQTQTRRHSFIVSLLGIKHVVVAINKMDLVEFSQTRFNEIQAEYAILAQSLGIKNAQFVPISALKGDNVVDRSLETPWYQGPTLMEELEVVTIESAADEKFFRFPVQYVNRPNLDFRGFAGTVASGSIEPGDQIKVLPSGQTSTVKSIVTMDGDLAEAFAPMSVTLTLNDEIDISRGDMIVKADCPELPTQAFSANLVWMDQKPLQLGRTYDVKFVASRSAGRVSAIQYKVDVNTLEKQATDRLELNEIAEVELQLERQLLIDPYSRSRATGAFILIDRLTNSTVAAGMVSALAQAQTDNDIYQQSAVSVDQRANRLGQWPSIIGFNNASDALLFTLEKRLFDRGYLPIVSKQREAFLALKQSGLIVLTDKIEAAEVIVGNHPDAQIYIDPSLSLESQLELIISSLADFKLI